VTVALVVVVLVAGEGLGGGCGGVGSRDHSEVAEGALVGGITAGKLEAAGEPGRAALAPLRASRAIPPARRTAAVAPATCGW
jgi:hypothetical protein